MNRLVSGSWLSVHGLPGHRGAHSVPMGCIPPARDRKPFSARTPAGRGEPEGIRNRGFCPESFTGDGILHVFPPAHGSTVIEAGSHGFKRRSRGSIVTPNTPRGLATHENQGTADGSRLSLRGTDYLLTL